MKVTQGMLAWSGMMGEAFAHHRSTVADWLLCCTKITQVVGGSFRGGRGFYLFDACLSEGWHGNSVGGQSSTQNRQPCATAGEFRGQ